MRLLLCLGAALAAALLPRLAKAELGVNVYGLSYHFERARAKQIGTSNEVTRCWRMRRRASA